MQIINYEKLDSDFFSKIEFEAISSVEEIVKEVKNNGDDAVKKYVKLFDNEDLTEFLVTNEEILDAYKKIDAETIKAIKKSKTLSPPEYLDTSLVGRT